MIVATVTLEFQDDQVAPLAILLGSTLAKVCREITGCELVAIALEATAGEQRTFGDGEDG